MTIPAASAKPEEASANGSSSEVVTAEIVGIQSPDVVGLGESGHASWSRGQRQPSQYRDAPFAVLFLVKVAAILVVAMSLGIPAIRDSDDDSKAASGSDDDVDSDDDKLSTWKIVTLILTSALAAAALSGASLVVMMRHATAVVKTAFVASPGIFVFIAFLLFASGDPVDSTFGSLFIFFAFITVCYAWCYWAHIPFASANLTTALTAIQSHYGVMFVGYAMTVGMFIYFVIWILAATGVYHSMPNSCYDDSDTSYDSQDDDDDACNMLGLYTFLLLLAFYWAQQVFQNTTRVTVAGTVGTWWFEGQEAPSCCSEAVSGSFVRSITYSFGSICFGSLIVALIETLRQTARQARRRRGECGLLLCVIECILACIQAYIEYFSDWAYVYVGLYGYGFADAARNVMTLFQQRGFTTIITNGLLVRVLWLTCLTTGALTGLVTMAIGDAIFLKFSGAYFLIGWVMGTFLSSVMLTVVDGAAKTCIVCFAEAPAEFESNHPLLSVAMRQAYSEAYPGVFGSAPPARNIV